MRTFFDDWPRTRVLAGGYLCDLTVAEANAWRDYAIGQPAYLEYRRSSHAVDVLRVVGAGRPELTAALRDALVSLDAAETVLYGVGKAWYAALKAAAPASE